MIATLVVLTPVVAALLLAASARVPSLASTLLVAYLALVAATVGVVLALSPFRAVTRNGLAAAELVVLATAVGVWLLRGRPGLPLGAARVAPPRRYTARLETVLFAAAVVVLLGYELVLGLAVPPTHMGLADLPPRPGGGMGGSTAATSGCRTRPPTASTSSSRSPSRSSCSASPPRAAGRSTRCRSSSPSSRSWSRSTGSPGGSASRSERPPAPRSCSRRCRWSRSRRRRRRTTSSPPPSRSSRRAFSSGRLRWRRARRRIGRVRHRGEAHDRASAARAPRARRAARPPRARACGRRRGRRSPRSGCGATTSTRRIPVTFSGYGGGRVENTASPSWPGSAVTALYLLYETMDLSALSDRTIGRAVCGRGRRRGRGRCVAVGAAGRLPRRARPSESRPHSRPRSWWSGRVGRSPGWRDGGGIPVRGPGGVVGPLTRRVNEDFSAFGPLGARSSSACRCSASLAYARRWARVEVLVVAAAVPVFVTLLVLQARWNEFLTRFLLVPVVLAAPLLAVLFRSRLVGAAFSVVAVLVAAVTILHVQSKPFHLRPWSFTQAQGARGRPGPRGSRRADRFRPPRPPARLRRRRAGVGRARISSLRPAAAPPRRIPPGDGCRARGRDQRPLLRGDHDRHEPLCRRRVQGRRAGASGRSGSTGSSPRSRRPPLGSVSPGLPRRSPGWSTPRRRSGRRSRRRA